MALFRRNAPDSSAPPARASVANASESAQLRGRARRRLVGAVALVLAAVIVLPMALDSEPVPVASDIPIVIPERASSYQPQFAGGASAEPAAEPSSPEQAQTATPPASHTTNNTSAATAATPSATTAPPRTNNATASNTSNPATTAANTATPTSSKPAASTTTPTTAPPARSDDGSRALALLEGRASGYVLQIAAYTSQSDAQTRRDQLVKAGVANAFVAQATVNGKTQYRLRVGPFASRDAAQAAQPRLRKLGYDNGFIAAQ